MKTELRKRRKNDFEKDFLNLMNNKLTQNYGECEILSL